MASSERQILNLLHRYAECIDDGDLEAAADLFTHAHVYVAPNFAGAGPDGELDRDGLLANWRDFIALYPNGTPRTKHVITNEIIDVDEDAGTGEVPRSYYTVFQQTDDFPLQPVIAGRYDDRFERVDGAWRYSWRNYSLMELIGDMSRHGKQALPS